MAEAAPKFTPATTPSSRAGFSGLYMLPAAQAGLTARVYEAGTGSAAPVLEPLSGARVDHRQPGYSYSFSPTRETGSGTRKYAPGRAAEIRQPRRDRFDLRKDLQLETKGRRRTSTRRPISGRCHQQGDVVSARYCIMGDGLPVGAQDIDITGADASRPDLSTSRWPHEAWT